MAEKEFTEVVPTLTHPYAPNIYDTAANAPFCRISNMNTSKIYTIHFKGDHIISTIFEYKNGYWSNTNPTSTVFIHDQSSDYVELKGAA